MRMRYVLPVLFVALAAVPADAGLGGLVRGASKAAASSSRAASGASRAAASATRGAVAAAPVAVVRRGAPRAVTRLPPQARQDAALVIVMHSSNESAHLRAAKLVDDAPTDEAVHMRSARNADAEAAAKDRRELVKSILENSPDAVEAVLDAQDAAGGDIDSNEVPALDSAEWVRHAQRLKRITALMAAGQGEAAKRLRDKEVRRHDAMLARLYNNVGSAP